ncbi:cytochrome P450 [Streptosporangium sandarakinum]|uniref:Pikromycin synthase n=1 Tax=Streptosporangium sandarakinum TaxID=1260955 RepID=A0A852V319_9ACTN|nr:cytochrome P450 [Streptosporangium sandarakinum]NYF41624.1 pikromycin synthase [Streptosporangium sandarakinum]
MTTPSHSYPFGWPSPVDQPKELADLHAEPIVPVTLPSGDTALLITRYDDIRQVLADPRVSKNRNRPDVARMTAKKVKVFQRQVDMDPPGHTRMRRLIGKAFTAHRVERLRPRITEIVEELLDELERAGGPVDLNRAFSYPLTIRIICELLGVPEEERANFGDTSSPPWGYMRDLIARKRENPDDELISALIKVSDEDDGRLSEEELHWWSTLLLLAGYETTASQLSGCVVLLLAHPGQLALVREDPGRVPAAVEELLRCQVVGSSLSMLRYVTEDIEVAGTVIPKGTSIIPALESANHDPAAFGCPARFDVTRRDRTQLTFSTGQHYCVGAPLARAVLQIGLAGLLRRFPGLRLAVPAAELNRQHDVFFQGFTEVPVAW